MSTPAPTAVSLEAARLEAAERATRLVTVVEPLWRSSRQWTAAVALAAFPLLFILDEVATFPLSPVLPGLAVSVLFIVFLPFLLVEMRARRYRRKDADWQARRAAKAVSTSRTALVLAAVWVLLWFAVGT